MAEVRKATDGPGAVRHFGRGDRVWAGALPTYRIFHVGVGGRLRLGQSFPAQSDEDAAAQARELLSPGQAAELWEGGRLVGRFSKTHEFGAVRRPR